ncbi:hypothetical protein G6F70_003176 [Rhizopus microsporus]|nr:hypothetical protein G6F71_005162 [Rhizopus microsporus]KAG1201407.1 hypothetical protein G6F70_003176 [Rhizopus microsporus]KAG1210834.1 hypothetical protein G6F69_005132 [Rhizopus microsporus]KAG1228376.1 hypothetical protein G6F67_007861 [Rhizopus microsporus]KAG1263997.1 hypothetical protein G6F68_004709 [Rhizopus microsporus]
MISLAVAGQIDLTSTLWFTGIWNIASGLLFQVPVCVQPMKAIAAVVLTRNMTIKENMAAGLSVAAFIFFFGITRTIHLVGSFTPTAVIKGLQLGTAVQLIIKAHNLAAKLQWKITTSNWADNNTWVLLSFMFVVLCYRTRVPSALILFLIGLLFALILMFVENTQVPRPSVMGGHYPDMVIVPSTIEFKDGFLNAGLGQLPLTALNSVIALCALIHDLFPDNQTSTSGVAMSVGLMNLIGCWFGAMPVCHGSGGLAGQYRFGARSEVSVILLGLCKLILGILFGSSVVGLLQLFPNSILAVMMFISGVELGCSARSINDHETDDTRKRENFTLMLLTAGALVAYSNDGIGFVTGLVSAILLSVQRLGVREWWHQLSKGIRSIPQRWINQRDYLERTETLPESQEERVSVVIKKSPGYGSQHNQV